MSDEQHEKAKAKATAHALRALIELHEMQAPLRVIDEAIERAKELVKD
jgi:hypothetical protein